MVQIDSNRMYTVTEAKPKLHALIAEATKGHISHLVKGSAIVAHLVPPTAPIIEDSHLLDSLTLALMRDQATDIANEMRRNAPHGHAGDHLGRLFAWAWQTNTDMFMKLLSRLHELVSSKLGRTLSVEEVVNLVNGAMEVRLLRSQNDSACQYFRENASEWLYFELPQSLSSIQERERANAETSP